MLLNEAFKENTEKNYFANMKSYFFFICHLVGKPTSKIFLTTMRKTPLSHQSQENKRKRKTNQLDVDEIFRVINVLIQLKREQNDNLYLVALTPC